VWLAVILLGHSLLHFAMGWVLGLSGDEAHYALYAAHLDASYYDHPPLVGWIQWPLVVLNAPEGVLRLIPEALWAITGWLIFVIARRLHAMFTPSVGFADAAGLWAALIYSLSPILHILGIGLLPDSLLMLFTAAVLWQTLRLFEPARVHRHGEWLLLGALLGLAGLAKYTAILVALPVLICLVAVHGGRLLLRPAPWLAMLLAVVLVLPVFVWNAQHDWISFAYQLHHGAGSQWQWEQVALFGLVQLLMYPLLVWGALGLVGLNGAKGMRRPQAWLLGFFALPFSVLMVLSGGGSGLPHWAAPAWVALCPFAGVGLAALWVGGQQTRFRRLGLRAVTLVLAAVQAAFCLIMYTLMLLAGPTWMSSTGQPEAFNPFTDFYGWDAAGRKAQQLAREHQISRLAVQNWTLASRLAWYARPLPVHVIAPGFDQFSLWSGELPLGTDAVLMDWSQMAYKLPLGEGRFERCEPLDTVLVERAGRTVARFAFYHCIHWGGKPAPQRLDEP
jgi:4-amino-4-deoxy-L-arabinose transferase-like glycosyltransferase